MPPVRQPGFQGGELAPTLHGRSDLPQYAVGLARCRNFYAAPHGVLLSRPGTRYAGAVKDHAKKVRLIPFVASATEVYVLEFGDLYIRWWRDGAQQQAAAGGAFELASPFLEADLPLLKYAQDEDVLTLTHPSYTPRELRRVAATWNAGDWTLTSLSFDRPALSASPKLERYGWPAADATHAAREWEWVVTELRRHPTTGVVYESAPVRLTQSVFDFYKDWRADITYKLGTFVRDPAAPAVKYESLQNSNLNHALTDAAWWAASGTTVSPTPTQVDTLPSTLPVFADQPQVLRISSAYGLLATDPDFLGYRVYRGFSGRWGWVGDSKTGSFTDVGDEPDYALQPPAGRNPFKVHDGTGAVLRTEEPAAVTYFEQRRVFAATVERPSQVWASRTGDPANFDSPALPVDDAALSWRLSYAKRQQVRAMLGLERLLLFSDFAVWVAGGGAGEPLSPSSIDSRAQAEPGAASYPDPLVAAEVPLYVPSKGGGVLALQYGNERGKYSPRDVAVLASHLFEGHTVVDWAYARDPHSIVWLVRSDGMLLSLTFRPDVEIAAWAWHDTQGDVEAVCAVPEGREDAVYLVVARTVGGATRRYVERMTSRVLPMVEGDDGELVVDTNEVARLDSAIRSSGAPTTTITGLSHLEGLEVWAVADGNVAGPLTVSGGAITLQEEAEVVHVGLTFTPEVETLDMVERSRMKAVKEVVAEVEASRGLWAGEDFDHLWEWDQRAVEDEFGAVPYATGQVQVAVTAEWNRRGRVVLRQVDPLHVAIVGLTREVEGGG
jgi:hypothetical protein